MPRRALGVCWFAVLAVVSLIAATARAQGFANQYQEKLPGPPDALPAPPKPVRYVMTISGGISLGAYEAGFNWTLLRHLKRHRAVAAVSSKTTARTAGRQTGRTRRGMPS